ncbi:MAG: lysostaphin resistance A-like protein [Pseudobacter sp.]|uniref:CPBP family intramembrane glutamic endopeptidase n=1 Tax=Pseudobacter sp. TaxID=2045420 RepID=UPI003F7E1CFE
MLGIIVGLLISWLLLYFFEKKHLTALGIGISSKRMRDLGAGILGAAACCLICHLAGTIHWKLNKAFTSHALFTGAWYVIKSVLFEELLFRGALLYIAIRKMGMLKACILSALCFGIYHIFTYQLLSNPGMALLVFFMTVLIGVTLAYAFAATQSMYLPTGLHLGWNLINIIIFSSGPLGKQLLTKEPGTALQGIPSLLVFLFQLLALPLFTWWYVKRSRRNTLIYERQK